MSNSGGFAVSRSHGSDRFYSPPALRRQHQQILLQQQEQLMNVQQQQQLLQRPVKAEAAASAPVEDGNPAEFDDSVTALAKKLSACSSSPPERSTKVTNLDRLLESVTPLLSARHLSEVNVRGGITDEAGSSAYFCLEDLWESFSEWSAYGVGVPLLLNGKDQVVQYYVPFLSGIQLYVDDPMTSSSCIRRDSEEKDFETREMSNGVSSNCEVDKKDAADELPNGNISKKETSMRFSGVEAGNGKSNGQLVFEYMEREQPHHRRPLADKVAILASQFPELKKCRSCDLMPSSWISVAWYPIYRIPIGQTLRDLDASFLTFHTLSTRSQGRVTPQLHSSRDRKTNGRKAALSKFSLPAFGLASYKLSGSLLSPSGPHESEQGNNLLQAAVSWLRDLQVYLPDYQFFISHNSQWR